MMLPLVLTFLIACSQVQSKAVFAHFMVGNTAGYGVDEWKKEIQDAQDAHIDAFALNLAYGWYANDAQLQNAFSAAGTKKFNLFFSFDFAGNGSWPEDIIDTMLTRYTGGSTYYKHDGSPFVSTFEGPDDASIETWKNIRKKHDIYFVPDWSSKGAKLALEAGGDVVDGLFSWAGWPTGAADMNTYVDASYLQYLEGAGAKDYMMPVSPWFFTNMPGFDKNWLWRGDDLWYDRWQHVDYVQPEFVQIISWNDWGECHYVGDIPASGSAQFSAAFEVFVTGQASNYAANMPHDGWRKFLPYVIDLYKNNVSTITHEGVVGWYRLGPAGGCGGWTTGNTHSQYQYEYPPEKVVQDKVFFSALLGSSASVSVSIGGVSLDAKFTDTPSGGIGIYHGSVDFTGHSGAVTITVSRGGSQVASFTGAEIGSGCKAVNGVENFNAWVGWDMADNSISVKSGDLGDEVCVKGWGYNSFLDLCQHACQYGYCPIGACLCENMGPQKPKPSPSTLTGYPLAGESEDYSGLCSFDCTYGDCNPEVCGTEDVGTVIYTSSPFLPPTCNSGAGNGNLGGLCSFACNFGYCPINNCSCTGEGVLNPAPPLDDSITAFPIDGVYDNGLCKFAAQHGYSPLPTLACAISTGDSAYCDSEDSSQGCAGKPVCDLDRSFGDLKSLALAVDESAFPPSCASIYILPILRQMLFDVRDNYTDVDKNYDAMWDWYQDYINSGLQGALNEFMISGVVWDDPGPGNAFFDCIFEMGGRNRSAVQCPVDTIGLGIDGDDAYTIYFILKDEDGFFNALNDQLGIPKSWVQFGERHVSGSNAGNNVYYEGYPKKIDNINVPNPKDVFTNSKGTEITLELEIAAAYLDAVLGLYAGNLDDVVQSVSHPVFLWAQAVSNMEEAKEIGEEQKNAFDKAFILQFFSGILTMVPFVTAGVVNSAFVAEIFNSLAWLASGGLAIYSTIQDPTIGVVSLAAWLIKDIPATRGDGAVLSAAERQAEYAKAGFVGRTLGLENAAALGSYFNGFRSSQQEITKLCFNDLDQNGSLKRSIEGRGGETHDKLSRRRARPSRTME